MTKDKTKTPIEQAIDRVVDNKDNMPPEPLPMMLARAEDLPTMMKTDVDAAVAGAIAQLDSYANVPPIIETQEVYERATTLATRIKTAIDDSETLRTKHKAPYLAATRVIDDAFNLTVPAADGDPKAKPRVLKKELIAGHAALKSLLSAYDTRQYLAEKARADQERAKLATAMADDGIELAVQDAPAVALQSTGKSAHGGASVRKLVQTWEVVDEALVPRSLMSIDPAKVAKMLEDGAKSIPGIAIGTKVETHVKKR